MRRALTSVAVGCSLVLVGCGSSSDDAPSSSDSASESPPSPEAPSQPADADEAKQATEPATITISDFEFDGPETVAPGAEVEVVNDDRSSHSVTSESDDFTEVVLEGGGATGTFTAPSEPGTYTYVCKFHPEMVAKLVVR